MFKSVARQHPPPAQVLIQILIFIREYQNSDEIIEDNWKEQLCKYVRNVGDGRRLDGQRFAEARKPIRTGIN